MSAKNKILAIFLASLVTVALIISGSSFWFMYRLSLEEQTKRLYEMTLNYSQLFDAIQVSASQLTEQPVDQNTKRMGMFCETVLKNAKPIPSLIVDPINETVC